MGRAEKACVSGLSIQQEALKIFNRVYDGRIEASVAFSASEGWKTNFLQRHDLVLRRITTSGRDLPRNSITAIREFINDYQLLRGMPNYERRIVINGDETAIYLDAPSNYTYEVTGTRRVKANTCGSERTRLSALFTASASGEKFKIYIIVPRETDLPD